MDREKEREHREHRDRRIRKDSSAKDWDLRRRRDSDRHHRDHKSSRRHHSKEHKRDRHRRRSRDYSREKKDDRRPRKRKFRDIYSGSSSDSNESDYRKHRDDPKRSPRRSPKHHRDEPYYPYSPHSPSREAKKEEKLTFERVAKEKKVSGTEKKAKRYTLNKGLLANIITKNKGQTDCRFGVNKTGSKQKSKETAPIVSDHSVNGTKQGNEILDKDAS
ncbi:unnamed protein product [Moneuplotes crassus]|uniref:Uncharacterized protein n=1 Tax=Euplotes crassus TaxID=5936 RepID=A0AAD1UND7_EUPCR|nr:unnamed protein product [Moneuplotes crassus]